MKRRILSIVLMLGWLLVTANQNYACPPQNQDPIASLTAIPERPPLDINVMLDGSASTDPDGYIREYQWDFNYGGSFDANYYETSSYHPDGAFDGITKHPYGSTGVYTVMLMVTDNEYATDTDTCKVYLGSVFNVTRDTVHNTIQAGIDDANDGDLIRVYPGMYGAVDFNDKKIIVESSDPNNGAVVAQTIIDAASSGNAVTLDHSEDANSVLRGFTITGGQRGIYCDGTSPAIRNCVIINNNSDDNGAGIYCNNASPSIIRCVIAGNYSAGNGGGLYCSSASPTLVNCVFSDNDADYGGGICDYNSSPDVTNCTFYGNIADANGGAMYNYGAASCPNVTNCIFWGSGGGEIVNDANANPNVTYCDVAGAYTGNGNIDSDPNLMNVTDHAGPDGAFGTRDDGLRIMAYSPCVDAADGDAAPATDITGLGRVNVPYADHNGVGNPDYTDIGAYESRTVWFVDVNVADSNDNDGSSWDKAFKYLQDALDAAANGSEIWVAVGTYRPDRSASEPNGTGVRAATFQLKAGVDIYGGFEGKTTGPQPRNWAAYNKTILSGDIGSIGDANDNSDHVVKGADEALLDGFTITAGMASGTSGGGIYCGYASPTIRNCVIIGNRASRYGGGMYNESCTPGAILTDCFFIGNQGSGGGVHNLNSDLELTNCVFWGNKKPGSGVAAKGGGIRNRNSSVELLNCTFSRNAAGVSGGGMDNDAYSVSTLTNCIFWGNTDSDGSNADQAAQINTSAVPVAYNCCIQGWTGSWYGQGNIGGDMVEDKPKFVDKYAPAGKDKIFGTADDGLALRTHSPCLDKGSDVLVPAAALVDVAGAPRIVNGDHKITPPDSDGATVDMGAYELPTMWYVDCNVSDSNYTGTSWPNAYDDLEDALGDANILPGDEIWVATGTYTPGANSTDTFLLIEGVAVYGGFDATETARRQRNWTENQTILSGDLDSDDVNDIPDSNNCYHVVTGAADAVLDGFTIKGGNADGSGADSQGGAIFCDDAPMRIDHCTIIYNWASSYGGGLYNQGSPSQITNSLFTANRAGDDGGAIYNKSGSDAKLVNCTITGNKAANNGGGVCSYQSSPTFTNCILWNNLDGGDADETAQISGPVQSVTHSCIQDANANDATIPFGGSANHNIDDNPDFIDPGYWDWRKLDGGDFSSGDIIAVDPCRVTIYDFSKNHDSFNRGKNIVPEYDGDPTNDGFVKHWLEIDDVCDVNGYPAHVGGKSKTTSAAKKMEEWFNADSVNHKNPAPWEAVVVPDWKIVNPDTGLFEFKSGEDCYFFPVDIVNDPNFDWEGFNHNYFFTFQYRDECTYIPGHQMEFKASDDLFVYINGKLIIDRGGLWGAPDGNYGCWSHSILELVDGNAVVYNISLNGPNAPPAATISLSLSEGDTYHFDVFFANRDATRSIFQMQAPPEKMQLYYIVGDYHLNSDSNCIDVGDNNAVLAGAGTDLGVYPRFLGAQSVVDMGAYEYGVNQQPADVNAGNYPTMTVAEGKVYLGNARFTDDGLPVPPGEVSITWTCIDYPAGASVTFDDANELNTYVRGLTLSTGAAPNNPYVLQLDVDDGDQNVAVTTSIYVLNYPPEVDAGDYGPFTVPKHQLNLTGWVTDETLPDPPNSLTTLWECINCPNDANVTFDNPNAVNTTVRGLTVADSYTLRLTADDGELDANDTTTITVINYAPVVYAGADKAITLPYQTQVHLSDASVSDDTLPIPPNSLTISWSCKDCPGSVTFDPPNEPNTWVRNFSAPGIYKLQLYASDGECNATDDVNVVVSQEFTVEAGPDKTIELPVHKATLYGAYISGVSGDADVTWSAVSCSPGANLDAVGFDNNTPEPNNVVTGVTLPTVEGDYVLELRVESGQTEKTDYVKITIGRGPGSDYHDPPQVEAGDYNAITLPDILDLNDAWVTDDGQPYGLVTTGWSMLYGPAGGMVDFDDPNFVQTTVEFSLPGTYTLMLQASDGEKDANDLTVITVYADPNQNDPPEVYAGSDYSGDLAVGGLVVDFDNDLTEEPSVTDDGLPSPPGDVNINWWVAVGDVTAVSFSNTSVVKPTVTFTKTGTYVLQLDADDGEFVTSDEMKVDVNLPGGYSAPQVNALFSGERECDCAGGCHEEGEITLPEMVYLYGDVTEGTYTPTTRWLMLSGPSPVTFGDTEDVNTTAKFSQPGLYVIQLRADDGMMTVADNVTITVRPGNRLSGGEAHTLVVDNNKKAWSCGHNLIHGDKCGPGMLGVGSSSNITELLLTNVHDPNSGQLQNIQAVAAGAVHSLALDSDRNVWAWGNNEYGDLGIGITKYSAYSGKSHHPLPIKVRAFEMVYDPCLFEDLSESDFTGSSNSNNIDALHVLANGHIILSTDSSATLGGLTFDEGDVVDYDPQEETAKLKFSINQGIDAIHWIDDQNVILSTTGNWDFGGETYKKGDLVKYDPCSTTGERYFDADNFGWTSNIDAVYVCDNNNIILSTENDAQLGGIVFKNNCLIEYNPNGAVMDGLEPNTARLYFQQDLSLSHGALDAVFITDSNDIILSTAEDDTLAELSFRDGDLVKCKGTHGYLEDILAIAAGRSGRHSLAVKNDGSVWAWGMNNEGQVGNDKDEDVYVPVPVFGVDADAHEDPGYGNHDLDEGYLENIVAVAAGEYHSMALEKLDDANDNCNGRVYTWGYGGEGALGNGFTESSDIPVIAVAPDLNANYWPDDGNLVNIVAISAGWGTSMALEKLDPCDPNCNGRVYTWGTINCGIYDGGLLGDGKKDSSRFPIIVHAGEQDPNHPSDANYPLRNIVSISAGESHFMGLDVNGHIWTWGFNGYYDGLGGCSPNDGGQLGNGTWDDSNLPVKVIAPDRNGDGTPDDLDGDGDPNNDYLGDDIPIVAIAAGYWHSLAMDAQGTIYSWGYGEGGRLGIGSEDNEKIPQVVLVGARVHNLNKDTWYSTIQQAINDADDGDTLVASEGTYYENIEFDGKTLTLTSSDPNDWDVVSNTIIDSPNRNYDVVTPGNGSNSTITGFTITHGFIGINSSYASPTITKNIIKDNSSDGISCESGTPVIEDNWITGNDAVGVSISIAGTGTLVANNTIVHNSYGIDSSSNTVVVTNCILWQNGDNSKTSNITGTFSSVTYCAVGGADPNDPDNFDPGDPRFTNPFDFVDITTDDGTESTIEVTDASKYDVNDVIEIGWDGNIRTVNDVNTDTNIVTFEPNLSSPTVFGTPLRNWGIGATDIYEDWHITADSNCKNAGDPGGDYTGQVDIDGQPRKLLGRVDVGADEYAPLSVDAGADKEVIIGQKLTLAGATFTNDPCDDPGQLSWIWSSTPDTNVVFDSNTVIDTNVTFYDVGIYTLQLDGYKDYDYTGPNEPLLAGGDALSVIVNPWAGADKILYWPDNHVDLNDANASGADSVEWVQFWGTADVEFVNDTNAFTLHPELNLRDVGIYGLELLAKDTQGNIISSDTVWISVLMQMVDVHAGSYPPVTLSANRTATIKLAGTVSGIVPSYTYWMGPESAVFADPCALDTEVTFTAPGFHPLELRAYTQDHQLIGAATTFITVYGASVVDAGEYDPVNWPQENSVELAGRIVSGDPDWTQWSADANYVSFDDPCKLDAEATFSEPAVYQLRLTAYDNGMVIGEDDVWITVNPVTVNASLDANSNVDDGQITFPNKADLYALSPSPGSLPNGVSMVWETTSQYVTLDQSSGWEQATAEFKYPGSYYVALVARKDNSVTGWDIIHITVSQPQGVVDAGPDQEISLAQPTLQLSGTILGTEPPDVNYLWLWSSYEGPEPCMVTFDPNDAKDTNATFYTTGIYELRFEVYAGDVLFGTDTLQITVSDDNHKPTVKAGYKKMGVVNTPISLSDAMVWDESDIAELTLLWQVDSSPPDSNVIFDPNYSEPNDSNELNPDVKFDTVGPYTLKLTATDPCNNSGTGYLDVLIGTATQKTVISAGRDKTVILPDYSVHLHDAWVFPVLEDNMTVQWTAPNVPDGGYVSFIDPLTLTDPCDSVLRPLVTFSQDGNGNDVVTGAYVLELTLSILNEPNNLTDRLTVAVENNDVSDPIITMFYAAIDGNAINNNDSNLQGLIDILVVAEDEDLYDVTLELDESKILNPDNTEILEGTPQNIRKMRRTYSIHTSQISMDANYHTLTVTATDTADNNDTAQITFHIKKATIIKPVARISGYKDDGASQVYTFAEEPNVITVIGKGLLRLIGAAYDPNDPNNPDVDYKIDLFTAPIGDAPIEYWNPTYKIYHDCFVKNLTGDDFVSGSVGDDSNDGVLAGPNPNLDLTGVENGSYQLLLTARAGTGGNYQYFQTHVGFVLDTHLKVGNVKFTQEDLTIPVGGIPLRVTRTYDSLARNVDGAFGYGWGYSIADMDIELNERRTVLTSSSDWEDQASVRIDSNYNRNVTLTLPNGQRATFVFYLVPVGSQQGNPYAFDNYQAMYASPPGVNAKLETWKPGTEETKVEIMDAYGYWSSVWGITGALAYQEFYDFSGFVLTTEDGTRYHFDRDRYIPQYIDEYGSDTFWYGNDQVMARPCGPPYLSYIETRGGEKLSFNVSGPKHRIDSIEHDVNDHPTKTIEIEHHHGNVTKIWAPGEQQGQWPTLQYDYDTCGNLTKAHRLIDKAAAALDFNDGYQTTTYDYDDPCGVFDRDDHYVFAIKDERGLCPIMYLYDANGVLEAVRDARGNRIELSHDLGDKKEAVTDRTGRLKFYYYNDRGLVLTESVVIDSNEHILTQYTYDDPNYPDKPSAVADACDNTTYYKYDTDGRITEVNDPERNISRHSYDNIGSILETRQYRPDAAGPVLVNKTVNEYYEDYWGNPTSRLKLTRVADDANNIFEWTEYVYDDWNRLTDVDKVDPNDESHINITHYTYDDDGNFPSSPNSVTDAAGFRTRFDYDESGSQIKSWYDWVDPNNAARSCTVTTITEYDDAGRVARTLREVSGAQGGIQEYSIVLSETIYDAIGKPQIVYDQHDNATVYHYDESGNLVQTDLYDPSDNLLTRSRTLYDAEGRTLVTVGPYDPCDPNAEPVGTETVYDEFGRVIETARWADVDINLVDLVVNSKVVGKKVPDDAAPDNAWDGTGNEPSNIGWTCDDGNLPVVGSELSYSITEYDAVGRVKTTISLDENGYEWPTSYEYDNAGKQTAVIDPCGHDITRDGKTIATAEPNENLGYRTETEYLGTRRSSVTDANDNTTEFKYDVLGRVVKTIYPSVSPHGPTYGHVGYDSLGRRTWQSEQTVYSDGNAPSIIGKEFEYDDVGRLRAVILPDVNDPCNSDTPTYPRYEYDYDKYGNLVCIRDNIKQYADHTVDYNDIRETTFTYDELNNQLTRRLPDSRIEFKQYDQFARLIKSTDFAAQITGFDYNARGLLEYKKFYANDTLYTYDEPNQLYQYSYDTLGRNLAVDVNDIDAANVDTYLYDYDDQGQITEVNTPQGTIYYDYNDITGRRQFVRTPADGSDTEIEYTYDGLGRVWDVNVHRRNAEAGNEVTRYEYSPVGLLETIVHKVGGTNILTSTYSYDALNRLISLINKDSSQSTLSSYTYTLAAHGARRSVTQADGTEITWDYDNLNRLIEEDYNAPGSADDYTHEYIYDLIGNRLKRVVSGQPNTIYVYDPNNDRLVQETSDGDTIYYFYDDNGSLIEVNDLGSIRTYTHDFANKLVAASYGTTTVNYKYDPDGIRVRKVIEGGVTTDYLIDPYNHTGYPQVFIEKPLDANNTAYIIGSDVIAQADPADIHYFLYDGQGSVRQLANSVGSLVSGQTYNYDAYGNLINSVNPSTNLLYTGEWRDSHLGWDYLRARWYRPTTGRLNTIDPSRGNFLDPQSLHKYIYVHDNPTNGVDPSGRFFSSPYHGPIVHAKIGAHFIETSTNDRLSNRRINTILKTKVKWWGWNQPDLVDRTTTEVWEIKPLGTYHLGKVILGWYLYLLNTYDPLGQLWKPGATYTPPSVVQIDAMSFACVFPPIDGVIEYEVFDVRPAIAFVIAVEMYRLKAHLEMAKIRMVGLRTPF